MLAQILSVLLLIFGFGFVIFVHELGHFLAAKWVGIKVEQFAIGFGQAIISWRKGMGLSWGSSGKRYEELVKTEAHQGLGETEYRVNWIPLGGYVKMLGQDDLRPNALADDPRAYNRKSIGARMVVVSAGVIMNIIFAAIGFMAVFLMGFNVPPPLVGNVIPNSPAAQAGLQVGDRILYLDGKFQHDFTKISLNTALMEDGVPVPIIVRHPNGNTERMSITPARDGDRRSFLMLGIEQSPELRGISVRDLSTLPGEAELALLQPPQRLAVKPGEIVTHINGQAVQVQEYHKLHEAIQESNGKTIELTVVDPKVGSTRTVEVRPQFQNPFGDEPLNFAGLLPRVAVDSIMPNSVAKGKLLPGDVVQAISSTATQDQRSDPTGKQFVEWLTRAGRQDTAVDLTVLRDGQTIVVENLVPSVRIAPDRYGLGIGLGYDAEHPVVAGVMENSHADRAGLGSGATITSINGQPVANWFDVKRLLGEADPTKPVKLAATVEGEQRTFELPPLGKLVQSIRAHRYAHGLLLHERIEPRQTSNPFVAAAWGVTETRDFVLQFYLTLQRMFQGSVSYTNMMGPVGIFHAGTKFAYKGTDWLIWFLAMISANLAVVNFLPIPIVDGGLFTFLILEKLMGKPLSPRAQSIAQVVGLAVILSVFLLVTYQDISRFL